MDAAAFTIPNTCGRVLRSRLRCVARVTVTSERTHIMCICATPYAGSSCAYFIADALGPASTNLVVSGADQVFITTTNGISPSYSQAVVYGLESRVTSMRVSYQRQYPNLTSANNFTQESVMYIPPYSPPLLNYTTPNHGMIGNGSWIFTPTPCDGNIFRAANGTTDTYDPKYPWVAKVPLIVPYSFAKLTQQTASSLTNTEFSKDVWLIDIFCEHRGPSPIAAACPFTDQSLITIYLNSLAVDVIHRLSKEYVLDYTASQQSTEKFIKAFNRLPKHARRSMYPGVNNPMMVPHHYDQDALGEYLVHDTDEGWEQL